MTTFAGDTAVEYPGYEECCLLHRRQPFCEGLPYPRVIWRQDAYVTSWAHA